MESRFNMPSVTTTRRLDYRVFQALGESCGVMVFDPHCDEIRFRFRKDWAEFAPEEAGVLHGLTEQLETNAREMGSREFLRWVDENLSNTLSAGDLKTAIGVDASRTLQSLYRQHVASTVKEYETHLPLLSLRAAAGGLGPDREAEIEEWVDLDIPGSVTAARDYFLMRVEGRSMEPEIPDGSVCLFRRYYGGSRKGGIWLVQRVSESEGGGEVTIKRYERTGDRDDETVAIHMKPANPDFAEWTLDAGEQWRSVAEFIRVVE